MADANPACGRKQHAQIVQTCDILIGMFWTKLGTDTALPSLAQSRKSISLWSNRNRLSFIFQTGPHPRAPNLEQLRKLKDFKDTTYSRALLGSFCSVDELRTKLLRDLMGLGACEPDRRLRMGSRARYVEKQRFQPQFDQPQHVPVGDSASHGFQELRIWNCDDGLRPLRTPPAAFLRAA